MTAAPEFNEFLLKDYIGFVGISVSRTDLVATTMNKIEVYSDYVSMNRATNVSEMQEKKRCTRFKANYFGDGDHGGLSK
jgi:hypothetical protein